MKRLSNGNITSELTHFGKVIMLLTLLPASTGHRHKLYLDESPQKAAAELRATLVIAGLGAFMVRQVRCGGPCGERIKSVPAPVISSVGNANVAYSDLFELLAAENAHAVLASC